MRQGLAESMNYICCEPELGELVLLVARMKVKDGRVLMTFTYLLVMIAPALCTLIMSVSYRYITISFQKSRIS